MADIDVRPSEDRFITKIDWLNARHCFSFGNHFDPTNTGFGLLVVSNEDWIAGGGGFAPHSHADMEIVTWVLEGALEHRDSGGNEGQLYPGLAQRMSAGSGITHSEVNGSETEPLHLLQMWVVPDTASVTPSYEERDLNDALSAGGLVAVASGRGHEGALEIHQRDAAMYVARLTAGEAVDLPAAPFVHVFVAKGEVTLGGHTLAQGDAARLTDAEVVSMVSSNESETVVWEMHSTIAGRQ